MFGEGRSNQRAASVPTRMLQEAIPRRWSLNPHGTTTLLRRQRLVGWTLPHGKSVPMVPGSAPRPGRRRDGPANARHLFAPAHQFRHASSTSAGLVGARW